MSVLNRCLYHFTSAGDIKEVLLGSKPVLVPAMPAGVPANLTLLATRHIRQPGRIAPEQTIAAVDVCVEGDTIAVTRVRRTPWGRSEAVLDLVFEYAFLQEHGKDAVRDGQFWVVDQATGEKLTVWSGAFVPKIILNDAYEGIEHAIAAQDGYLAERRSEGGKGRFLSKGREFNLLPYYISMFKPQHAKYGEHGERVGLRIPVQDCGTFIRMFVPPEGGVSGAGDAISGMQDVMHYSRDGALTMVGLLNLPLV